MVLPVSNDKTLYEVQWTRRVQCHSPSTAASDRQVLFTIVNIGFAIAFYWVVGRHLLAHSSQWFSIQLGLNVSLFAYAMIAVGICFRLIMLHKGS